MPGRMLDAQILVVDDEPAVLSVLVLNLSRRGYRVTTAVDGQSALATAEADRPDLIVLDVMLPGIDGYEVLQKLRRDDRTGAIPVILITGRWEDEGQAKGFGADDYITKPFSARELADRVESLLRRSEMQQASAAERVTVGLIELHPEEQRAFSQGEEVELTPLEYRLLEVLLDRQGIVQTRRQLLHAVWNTEAAIHTRTIDMHVARLRSKLGPPGVLIETVRGVGYRLSDIDA